MLYLKNVNSLKLFLMDMPLQFISLACTDSGEYLIYLQGRWQPFIEPKQEETPLNPSELDETAIEEEPSSDNIPES